MNPATHPHHAAEQAYIERVQRAEERTREQAKRLPDSAGDKHAAREAYRLLQQRFGDAVDAEALCFGRIQYEGDKSYYLGRAAVHDEDSRLLVINWRMPKA